MAWPPPTPAGASFINQHDTELQQYEQLISNLNNPSSSVTPGGHVPTTSGEIAREHEFIAPHSSHQDSTLLTPQHLGGVPSNNDASAGWFETPRPYQQSPQGHGQGHRQPAGVSGPGGASGDGSAVAPSKSMLETRKSLQARGKNYHLGAGGPQGREWEERQRRDEAVSILESEEMIMWIAGVRNESIPQMRAHYRNIVLGLAQWEKDDVAWRDEWEVQDTGGGTVEGQSVAGGSPARSGKGKERDTTKMRKRVSSGQGHG